MAERRKILILSSGGAASIGYTRSLLVDENVFHLYGFDSDQYNVERSETHESIKSPRHTDEDYQQFLLNFVENKSIDFVHPQSEKDVFYISQMRDLLSSLGCQVFLPSHQEIELFRDKWKSYEVWKQSGIKVPHNFLIKNKTDLEKAFDVFQNNLWLREIVGAAGKGSLSRPSFMQALREIELNGSWGRVVAAEHLEKRTVTWQSIWWRGDLIACQGRLRLNWAFGNRAQSGVTGLTGVGETFGSPQLDELAKRCIYAGNREPHGIYSVDFTYNSEGVPNPTEINIGKFFTTHEFFSRLGLNMPLIVQKLVFAGDDGQRYINPIEDGWLWIRGIDCLPKLIHRRALTSE